MSKARQRQKQKDRRVRREYGLREQATAASRPRRRMLRAGVGVVAALAILLLGSLGLLISDAADPGADSAATASTTTATTDPDAPPPPPPCPAPDGSSPRLTLFQAAPSMCIDPTATYRARFVTTAGAFVADLDPQRSPLAVNNFVFLARYHFYDGLPFGRVVGGFYAQTGDPLGPDRTGPGYSFPDDPLPPKGTYGKGSMVFAHERADDNGSQFLIWLGDEVAELDHVFPLFGQVTPAGMGTLDAISASGGTSEDPVPEEPHRIERIDIIEQS
ncbi:MAG TPA: peptidylprolyl isomerase [Acidimicrobiales bacterium]|nr:peptidylprolyl isomerase [Acidimicrobiales bacterium]